MCRSRRELSNEYLLDEIGVYTAENEPLQVLFKIIQYYSIVSLLAHLPEGELRDAPVAEERLLGRGQLRRRRRHVLLLRRAVRRREGPKEANEVFSFENE